MSNNSLTMTRKNGQKRASLYYAYSHLTPPVRHRAISLVIGRAQSERRRPDAARAAARCANPLRAASDAASIKRELVLIEILCVPPKAIFEKNFPLRWTRNADLGAANTRGVQFFSVCWKEFLNHFITCFIFVTSQQQHFPCVTTPNQPNIGHKPTQSEHPQKS